MFGGSEFLLYLCTRKNENPTPAPAEAGSEIVHLIIYFKYPNYGKQEERWQDHKEWDQERTA